MAMDRMEILGMMGSFRPVVETIPVPEMGDGKELQVRGLTVAEYDAVGRYTSELSNGKAGVAAYGWRALTIAKGVCDADGKRLFTDADANGLSALPSAVATRLVDAIERLSAGTKAEREELAKN